MDSGTTGPTDLCNEFERHKLIKRLSATGEGSARTYACGRKCADETLCSCFLMSNDNATCLLYRRAGHLAGIVPSGQCPLINGPAPWSMVCSVEQQKLFKTLLADTLPPAKHGARLARKLIKKLRGRFINFIGDSVSGQQFSELVCAIIESTTLPFSVEVRDCLGVWGTGTCVQFYGAANGTRICYTSFDKKPGGRRELRENQNPAELRQIIAAFQETRMTSRDIAVLNIGIHHSPDGAAVRKTRLLG